ncbi:MAG: YnbE family lipoprotein [Asticcacaulis sp.]
MTTRLITFMRGAGGLKVQVLALVSAALTSACTPTINVNVKPITIYAKLDAEIRVKLDKEVTDLIKQNPNLF